MQVECRGNMFTMPRRRRFKPRIDCEAILGKLSSYSSLYHYIYNPSKPLFEGSTNIYNPPQTPPFEKEGLVVSLRLTSPKVRTIQIAILRYGHCLVVVEEILRCAQDDSIRGIARDI